LFGGQRGSFFAVARLDESRQFFKKLHFLRPRSFDQVFKEVGQAKPIPPIRRDLQRFAVTALMAQAGAQPGQVSDDARTVASDALKRLALRFQAGAKQPNLDDMTRVYLRDTADTIGRFIDRSISAPK
jgi:hypothetical protein